MSIPYIYMLYTPRSDGIAFQNIEDAKQSLRMTYGRVASLRFIDNHQDGSHFLVYATYYGPPTNIPDENTTHIAEIQQFALHTRAERL